MNIQLDENYVNALLLDFYNSNVAKFASYEVI